MEIALGGLGLAVLGAVAWRSSTSTDPTAVPLQGGTQSGKVPYTSNATLPRSNNQPEGATFSFEGWFEVNDFTYGNGTQRSVFNRADCPGLYLASQSGSILVTVATYGATETVLIDNIPAQKWIHIAIVITQYTVDVYINGLLRRHHTLTQLPKQEDAPTTIGDSKGFDGQVGGLTYYSRALSASEIMSHAAASPPPSLVRGPDSGQYFDVTWYTGR
jgi:hypothetical protein